MKTRHNIYLFFIIAIFLEAYTVFFIGSFPVTFGVFCTGFFCAYGVTHPAQTRNKSNLYAFLLLLWIWFAFLVTGMNRIQSVGNYSLMILAVALNYHTVSETNYNKLISLYSKITNGLAVYGILQLMVRLSSPNYRGIYGDAGFADFILEGHMTLGFNWTNIVYIGGFAFNRSNAIFLEPSYFSCALAINILLLITDLIARKKRNTTIIWIIINGIAYICTFAGSGFLIFMAGIVALWGNMSKTERKIFLKYMIKLAVFLGITLMIFSIFVNTGQLFTYMVSRLDEIFDSDKSHMSGATRFVYSWFLLLAAFENNLLLGYGPRGIIGLRSIANTIDVDGWVSEGNAIIQFGTQYGLVGLLLFVLLLIHLKSKMNADNHYANVLRWAVIAMLFLHGFGYFLFFFIYLVNVNITKDVQPETRNAVGRRLVFRIRRKPDRGLF